ncbi:hypothetical protein PVAP13_5NG281000 [Panicum virgatum]|uniref:Uncharacterized protein n=1 Tax=Panicum virgatum TaxID=38727 RepID=A0A8T0S0T7_PANVG|nr:hypothetical protein PVAP13_5NG281000 [Panicum virgatum]
MEQEVLEAALGRVGGIVSMVRKMEKISLTCGLHCQWMICQNHLPGCLVFRFEDENWMNVVVEG